MISVRVAVACTVQRSVLFCNVPRQCRARRRSAFFCDMFAGLVSVSILVCAYSCSVLNRIHGASRFVSRRKANWFSSARRSAACAASLWSSPMATINFLLLIKASVWALWMCCIQAFASPHMFVGDAGVMRV